MSNSTSKPNDYPCSSFQLIAIQKKNDKNSWSSFITLWKYMPPSKKNLIILELHLHEFLCSRLAQPFYLSMWLYFQSQKANTVLCLFFMDGWNC